MYVYVACMFGCMDVYVLGMLQSVFWSKPVIGYWKPVLCRLLILLAIM